MRAAVSVLGLVSILVHTAIYLYNELVVRAKKINDVLIDAVLTAKLDARYLPIAQRLP